MNRILFVSCARAAAVLSLVGDDGASAVNPIKLFAPWDAGYKWDTSRGWYFHDPGNSSHAGIDFNGLYDINGVDLGDDNGKPVRAAQDGIVVFAGGTNNVPCGVEVDIHHGSNVYTRYCHLQIGSLAVTNGSRVLHGQTLGNNGCTGTQCTLGPHIHFEVRTGGPPPYPDAPTPYGTEELPTPFDGATMADDSLFLSHNFQERLEIGYRDADWNGNQWPDIGAYEPQFGKWSVGWNVSNPPSFTSGGVWLNNWGTDGIPGDWRHLTGRFNSDTRTDIAVYNKRYGQWHVAISNGSSAFNVSGMWLNNFGIEAADGQYRPFSGDFNGDGKHDVAVYQPNAGRWFVAVNTGSSFSSAGALWLDGWAVEQQDNYWQNLVGDFNGDGKDDIAAYAPIIGRWVVAVSTGASFAPAPGPYAGGVWLDGFGVDGSSPGAYIGLVGRFAGSDSKADIGVYQPTQGRWWVAKTVGSSFVNQGLWLEGFGVENASQRWRPFVGDYAGTEITWDDIGVYAPVAGRWFVANNTHSSFQPVSGPYGGAWLDGWAVESYPGHYRTQ